MLKLKSPRITLLIAALCMVSGSAYAKKVPQKDVHPKASKGMVQYVLKDPVTDEVLHNTPYVLLTSQSAPQPLAKPSITDAQGRTKPVKGPALDLNDPTAKIILVQAEGGEGGLVLYNLNELQQNDGSVAEEDAEEAAPAPVAKATPYIVWNSINNVALCGFSNAQGFTNAYFTSDSSIWQDNAYVIPLKSKPVCSEARNAISQLTNKHDSESFESSLSYAKSNFAMTETQLNGYVFQHATDLIENKLVDINQAANKKAISLASDLAIAKKDAGVLNGLGYGLGFKRNAFKQALPLLTEALSIKPNDCYYTNSKGYILMRMGKYRESRDLLQASDVACNALKDSGAARDGENLDYPIAVNLAHLAENYGLSGDAYLANDFLARSLNLNVAAAKEEITEVVNHLTEKKIINQANLQQFVRYVTQPDVEPAQAAAEVPPEASKKARKAVKKAIKQKK